MLYLPKTSLVLAVSIALGTAYANVPNPGWGVESSPISTGGVTPYIIAKISTAGGPNRTCPDVGKAFFGNAEYYRCWTDKQDFNGTGFAADFVNVSGDPECDNTIGVTVTEGTYVSFTASPDGIGAAIIKGGDDANVYVYDPQAESDSGLASPLNASGNPAGLSNIGGFCWNPGQDVPSCYSGETAWAAGARFIAKGNWATYTPYTLDPVTLFAGQTLVAGTVTFSAPDDGVVTVTVSLGEGWRFALNPVEGGEYDNNIKVQDYAAPPPALNPAPGLFLWKTSVEGQVGTVEVPLNAYYGVHVDVEREVACPVAP